MKYKVLDEQQILKDNFFTITNSKIEIDLYEGGKDTVYRYRMHRPEIVAALLKNIDTDNLVLVEQFRYSATKTTTGWIREVVAGAMEKNESSEHSIRREIKEEAGYQVDELEKIFSFYTNVGLSDQIVHVYYGEVGTADKIYPGNGLKEENEDIRVYENTIENFMHDIKQGKICDATTINALQWYALNRSK